MLRYHFHCVDGSRLVDVEGVLMPDLQTVRQEAVRFAGEVLLSEPEIVCEKGKWRVEVTDSAGILLFTLITLTIEAPSSAALRHLCEKQTPEGSYYSSAAIGQCD